MVDFPSSPTFGDRHTEDGVTWTWTQVGAGSAGVWRSDTAGDWQEARSDALVAEAGAEAAATAAASDRAVAQAAAGTASGHSDDAEAAATAASAAQGGAEAAQTAAEVARDASAASRVGAEAARDDARIDRLLAQGARIGAETAEAGAEAAEAGAESARDAAILGAEGVYGTIADGLAGTSPSDRFVVANAAGWSLYLNDAGTETSLSGVFPSLETLIEDFTEERRKHAVSQPRPGELIDYYTSNKTGGRTGGAITATIEAAAEYGQVARFGPATLIAQRDRIWLEAGRAVAVRAAFRVHTDTTDLGGLEFYCRISWLDANFAAVGTEEVLHDAIIWAVDGWITVDRVIDGEDIAPPVGAVYAVPYVEVLGATGAWELAYLEGQAAVSRAAAAATAGSATTAVTAAAITRGVGRTLFVSSEGDGGNNGENLSQSLPTIEHARDLVAASSEPWAIKVYPGRYESAGNIDVPDNCTGIVSATNLHSTTIVPSAGNEQRNVFRVGGGILVEGFTLSGWQLDSLTDPKVGFALTLRPGAVINRAVYGQNLSVYRATVPSLIPQPLDRENGNPLVGLGAGMALCDPSVVSQYSIFPQIMLQACSPVSPNGIGLVAKNGGFINGINCVTVWGHTHYMALSGGHILLNGCASQFGDFSIVSDGERSVLSPGSTTETLVVDAPAADAILAARETIIDGTWAAVVSAGYSVDEDATRADAATFLTAIEYDLRSGQEEGSQIFARGLYDVTGSFVATGAEAAFVFSYQYMRNQIVGLAGVSGAAADMVVGLVGDIIISAVNSPVFLTSPSYVSAAQHQWNKTMTGVNARAFYRAPFEVPESIVTRNGGEVVFTGADDLGNLYMPGGLRVNSANGRIEGPPFVRGVTDIATTSAIIGGYQQ